MLKDYCERIATTTNAGEIILIGGFSRSGKTTFGSMLDSSLKTAGKSCHILSLDSWLLDRDQRGDGVMGRYDLSVIHNLIQILKEANKKVTLEIPKYDKLKQEKLYIGSTVDIYPNDILIIEGVIALTLTELIPCSKNYYIEIDENLRKSRVIDEYLSRGKTLEEATRIYLSRQVDEIPVILKSSEKAIHLKM